MRILLCHNYYQEPGGEDQVFADEGWLLESRGHEVIRYTRHNDDVSGMGRWELARKTLWNHQSKAEATALIQKHRPDVMHCHNTFPVLSPSIYAAANEAGVPVVQTLHNYRWLCPSALFLRDGRACEDCLGKLAAWPGVLHGCYRGSRTASAVVASMLAWHKSRGTLNRRVDQFIALSEFSRRKFIQGGLPAGRIAIKPNFVRDDPGAGDGRGGYVVFVGRLSPEKGISTLLAAWEKDRGLPPLRIVGDGPLADSVRAAAASDSRVTYLGRKSGDEVLSLVRQATCLILPSLCYENCPKTIIEAYAAGTPVIASRLGAIEEMIEPGRTGLSFEPGNADDLARCVRSLAEVVAPKLMRDGARAAYEEKYSTDGNYASLMRIYERALHDRSGRDEQPTEELSSEVDSTPAEPLVAGAANG